MAASGVLKWPVIAATGTCTAMLLFCYFSVFAPCSSVLRMQHQYDGRSNISGSDTLGAFFIIGATTVARHNASYLNSTLHSLQCALTSDGAQPTVLLLNGDIPASRHTEFENLWRQPKLRQFVRQGLVLIRLEEWHKELQAAKAAGGLPQTHGDPPERMWWRSKENLDKAFLIEAALNVSHGEEYYIQLEDDVRLAPNFLSKLYAFALNLKEQDKKADLISLFGDGSRSGGVAIAYRLEFLRDYVAFLRANFYKAPYDWMLHEFRHQHGLSFDVMVPNLVQHTGILSSLLGKVQLIASSSFNTSGDC